MTFSEKIYEIEALLKSHHCNVVLHCDRLPEDVAGRCDYKNSEVQIAGSLDAKTALLTIAHEGGHWFSFLMLGHKKFSQSEREGFAQEYGWSLLQFVGATQEFWSEFPSREAWDAFHIPGVYDLEPHRTLQEDWL